MYVNRPAQGVSFRLPDKYHMERIDFFGFGIG